MTNIQKIKITNILGIESLEYDPNTKNCVAGKNGTGKTSFLEAIRSALGTGTDATLLRKGSEKGEVVLVLDDGLQIRRRITADKSVTDVKHPTFGKSTKPATVLKELANFIQLDPVAFDQAPTKQRTDMLLNLIEMSVAENSVSFVPKEALNGVNFGEHGLVVLDKIAKNVYDLRTGVNRVAKEKKTTIEQLRETVPSDEKEVDWKTTLELAEDERKSLMTAAGADAAQIKHNHAEIISNLKQHRQETVDKISSELSAAIEKLRADSEKRISEIQNQTEKGIEAAEEDFRGKIEAGAAALEAKRTPLDAKITEARTMIEQQAKFDKTREMIETFQREAIENESVSVSLTSNLEAIEGIRQDFLKNIPFKGLEVKDGDIYLNGIPYDRVNHAERIKTAIRLAAQANPQLPLVIIDGLECFDAETRELWLKEMDAFQGQVFYACVTDGPFEILKGSEVENS